MTRGTPDEPLHAETAADWRAWLERHHAERDEVWLLIGKKSASNPYPTLGEATAEALCYGWIDSAMRPVNEEAFVLRYTPRRANSNWSARNRDLATRLIEEGRMTPAGLAKIREAERNGRWNRP